MDKLPEDVTSRIRLVDQWVMALLIFYLIHYSTLHH